MGRIVWEETPAGLATKHRYDENGVLAETWDNAGRPWQYFYDEGHNVTEMRERVAEGASMLCRHFRYDQKGRLIRETDACGNATFYVYEENRGEPSLIRRADGEETRYEYDTAGRRMAWEDACGREEYGYNARNFRTVVREGEGNETHAMYDGMVSLRGIRRRPGKRAEGTVYEYDGDGNNIRIRYPDGGCERIFYDAQGSRIKHVLPEAYDPAADDGNGTAYAYDAAGRLVKVTGADGAVEAEYAYDLAGNLVSETDAVGNTSYYACDLRGKRLQSLVPATEADGRTLYRNTTYTYDGNGKLTGNTA